MKAQEQVEKLKTLQESMHEIANKVVSLGDGSVMLNDVAEGKKQIADAINTKGGNSTPNESFQQLAEDIQTLPYAGISAEGIVQTEKFSFLDFICGNILNGIDEIYSNVSGVLPNLFKNSTIRKVRMPFITDIQESCFRGSALEEFDSETLSYISTESTFENCSFLTKVRIPNLIRVGNYTFLNCTALKEISLPSLRYAGQDILSSCTNLKNVNLVKLENSTLFLKGSVNVVNVVVGKNIDLSTTHNFLKLRNYQFTEETNNNLNLKSWTATDVIAEGQKGIDELNSNLYNNLLTKLYDHSEDGETRTLRLGWLAHVTQENIDYANAKGWTLTT